MRKTSAAILSLVLSSLLPTAYGQFGGGYAPPQPPSPPPTETPAVPVVPTVPAQTAPADPTEEEIQKYEEENPDAVQKPADPKTAEPKPVAPVDPKMATLHPRSLIAFLPHWERCPQMRLSS